jgi:hypothetical protein
LRSDSFGRPRNVNCILLWSLAAALAQSFGADPQLIEVVSIALLDQRIEHAKRFAILQRVS